MNQWNVKEEKLSDDSLVYNIIGPENIVLGCIDEQSAIDIADALNRGVAWAESREAP